MNRSYSKIRHIQESNLRLENKFMESKLVSVKPFILEQANGAAQIIKPEEDPFAYMKKGDKYYYKNVGKTGGKPSETDPGWKEETRPNVIDSIETKIFSDSSTTTTAPVTPSTNTDYGQQVLKITKDPKWQNLPCVPLSPGVKGIASSNGSEVSFNLNGKVYFNSGIFMTSDFKGQGSFSCSSDNKIVEKNFSNSESDADKLQKNINTLASLYPGLGILRST